MIKTISIILALSFLGMIVSCKGKKPKEVLTTQNVEVVEVVKPEPVVEKRESPRPVVKQMNYYLVAGCFKVQGNADRLHTRLLNEGYDSKIVPLYDMSMVTYDGYVTRQEAQVALNQIVRKPGKECTWVYPVK